MSRMRAWTHTDKRQYGVISPISFLYPTCYPQIYRTRKQAGALAPFGKSFATIRFSSFAMVRPIPCKGRKIKGLLSKKSQEIRWGFRTNMPKTWEKLRFLRKKCTKICNCAFFFVSLRAFWLRERETWARLRIYARKINTKHNEHMNLENRVIAVVGLGYVGLPLARLFSTKFPTIGYDINQQRVDNLMSGHDTTLEVSDTI